jgi:hypothetical protein
MEIEKYLKKTNFRLIVNNSWWQEVSLWLRYNNYSVSQYDHLSDYLKRILHNCILQPTKPTSERQQGELVQALLSANGIVAGRNTSDPISFVIQEEMKKLVPLNDKQKNEILLSD